MSPVQRTLREPASWGARRSHGGQQPGAADLELRARGAERAPRGDEYGTQARAERLLRADGPGVDLEARPQALRVLAHEAAAERVDLDLDLGARRPAGGPAAGDDPSGGRW